MEAGQAARSGRHQNSSGVRAGPGRAGRSRAGPGPGPGRAGPGQAINQRRNGGKKGSQVISDDIGQGRRHRREDRDRDRDRGAFPSLPHTLTLGAPLP